MPQLSPSLVFSSVGFEKMEDSFSSIEKQHVETKKTSLIIEKTEKPINNHFIFNEK
jgi:hypothetical protein